MEHNGNLPTKKSPNLSFHPATNSQIKQHFTEKDLQNEYQNYVFLHKSSYVPYLKLLT